MAQEGSRQDFLTQWFEMARDDALRQGMSEQEAEVCATALVERLSAPAWRHAVIANHVRDYLRALRRRRAHEVPWPQVRGEEGSLEEADLPAETPSPESGLLTEEFWRRMWGAIGRLSPAQREFFVWHDLGDLSIEELAASSGKTRHAARTILFRARARLREILRAEGLTEAELYDYLVHHPPPIDCKHSAHNQSRQDEAE